VTDESKQTKITIPPGAPLVACRAASCGEPIYWVKSAVGRNMPINRDGSPHFASCPAADAFRRRRQAAPAQPAPLVADLTVEEMVEQLGSSANLTSWELQFVADMAARIAGGLHITHGRGEKIRQIWDERQ